jgi:hypothetical protein
MPLFVRALVSTQQRQLFWPSVSRRAVPPRWPREIKLDTAIALEQHVQGYFALQPSQMRTQAAVWSQPEAKNALRFRADVELVWLDKMRWIAVRSRDAELDDRARWDCHPTNEDITTGDARYQGDGRFEPERLFDEIPKQRRFVTEPFSRIGVGQKQIDSVANKVPHSDMSSEKQQHRIAGNFFRCRLACLIRRPE